MQLKLAILKTQSNIMSKWTLRYIFEILEPPERQRRHYERSEYRSGARTQTTKLVGLIVTCGRD